MAKTTKVSLHNYGYVRGASAVPAVKVADVTFNHDAIVAMVREAIDAGAAIIVLPELSLTGYTCADLFFNEQLLDYVETAILNINNLFRHESIMIVYGAPLRCNGHLFNCAIVSHGSELHVVPKTYLPNYKEFYEKRWFVSASVLKDTHEIVIGSRTASFGTDLLFDAGRATVAVELCEDLWVPMPPSSVAAINGANILLNLSASNEVIGKHDYLRNLVKHQSNQCIAAYVYASAGYGESSTDLVFAGNAIIAENGNILAEAQRFSRNSRMVVADIDIESLEHERLVNNSFADCHRLYAKEFRHMPVAIKQLNYDEIKLERKVKPLPFVPVSNDQREARCSEVVDIQCAGLMRRLEATGITRLVIGISGGLDSTLALMVAVRAFDLLGLPRTGIIGITMPGFGTTGRTRGNAMSLMETLGVTSVEINIAAAVMQHFADIGQDPNNHDVTYENSQARERTQILMDYANKVGALVLGTGDLSELALGWATYNGDHMSMYNVNCSIPKTLVKHLVNWFAGKAHEQGNEILASTLLDVLGTPISPELTPADENDQILQVTEDIVGPYELHDFFLYNMLRHGYSPLKLFFLARHAFENIYSPTTIKHWLTIFIKRFFSQQFKRSCLPDGPKVGSVTLSPRGDWRMPSDAAATLWRKECENLPG